MSLKLKYHLNWNVTWYIASLCIHLSLKTLQFSPPIFGHFCEYMQIHIDAFPQSCRYGKYRSFATLVIPITVLGDEQFAFPCKVFFLPNFRWKNSEHEQKPKLVFVEAEYNEKYLTSFQHFGSLTCLHVQIQSPALLCQQVSWDWIWICEHVQDPKCLKLVKWENIIKIF